MVLHSSQAFMPALKMNISGYERVQALESFQPHMDPLEIADRMVEKFIAQDEICVPTLIDRMRITSDSGPTLSGLQDIDYPNPAEIPNVLSINHFKLLNKVPLPPEILEQCANFHGEFLMGIFPDINRAWMTVASDIYIWNFETSGDVAYFDGLSDTIVSVGLVKPKSGVFQSFIKHLLVLTTTVEIIVLGVVFNRSAENKCVEELQLTPDIIYSLPTDGVPISVISGTKKGRIFMGGRDGCLYELVYQKEIGWWGKRCKKINHSKGALSYLLPAFVSSAFSEDDPICEIAIDNSRNILYTLTEKGTVEVFDLGADGNGMSRVASLTQSTLRSHVSSIISTVDVREVSSIIGLCALEDTDSAHLGVVGVTDTGARLYLSTGSPPPHRPSTLQLLHVRLPPGYSAHSRPLRPNTVTMSLHKTGNFIYTTTSKGAVQDKVWCLSMDAYPVKPWISEDSLVQCLSGPAVALGELKTYDKSDGHYYGSIYTYQHDYTPDRFAILTQQGTDVFEKLRPVDILAEVLKEKCGPDNEDVKAYFMSQGHDQACAMALILACDHHTTNTQMAEWATRAFFLYGGDPRQVVQQAQPTNLLQYSLPSGFKPNTVSTPVGDKIVPRNVEGITVQMSAKHNGIYLYLSRILRPIWTKHILSSVQMDDRKIYLVSSVTVEEVIRVACQLQALRLFLDKNPNLNSCVSTPIVNHEVSMRDTTISSPVPHRTRIQEAHAQEKLSLDALRTLVDHSTQVLGFWKVISEHQFHVILESMSQEQKDQMIAASFRDLILNGSEICSSLITKLVNLYLKDNASVDTISMKLREVCPSLYRNEDAACSKANEILQACKDEKDEEKKQAQLRAAIKLCKEVSPQINLPGVCKQLTLCKCYDGVIDICQDVAKKLDVHNLAYQFVSHHQPPDDTVGCKFYFKRLTAYKELNGMFEHLYQQSQIGNNTVFMFGNPTNSQAQKLLEEVLKKCLALDDEIAHIVCYDWLIKRNLHNSLVSLGRPSIENFLTRYPVDSNLRDLLWQYHERTGNHAAAAQILYKLATTPGETIKLQQRLTYLGKAVMCMRSDGVGCAPHLGVFLHELEDLVQVARVQKQVLDRIAAMVPRHPRAEDACKTLNSSLLSITELYEDFAEVFALWECKLTILDCAGHDDKDLINSIWDNIISEELSQATSNNPDDQMSLVLSKVKSLGQQYTLQSPCFPVAYLVWQLEQLSCRLNVIKSHVHSAMISVGVSVSALLDIYDRLYSLNDRCWLNEGNELHLIQVIASFADSFTSNPRMVPANDRKAVAIQMLDLITNCLSTLYGRTDCNQLIQYLKTIQGNLNRI